MSALPLTPGQRLTITRDRLLAWAEDADMRLRRCEPAEEDKYRNLRNNYTELADHIQSAITDLFR